MEIKILDDKKNKLVIEVKGADHTLCNALKTELFNAACKDCNIQH